MIWLGIDPGKDLGVARVDVDQQIQVIMCDTWHDVAGFLQLGQCPANYRPKVAIEGWEYQGAKKSRGVPHQAEAYGKIIGILEGFAVPYVTVRRGQVLSSLGLRRSANKQAVLRAIRSLTTGVRPCNDHEADAVAVAIAGASVHALEGTACASRSAR